MGGGGGGEGVWPVGQGLDVGWLVALDGGGSDWQGCLRVCKQG